MTMIARARLTPSSISESLDGLAKEMIRAGKRSVTPHRDYDPLRRWLREPAVIRIRRIQRGIHTVLATDKEMERELATNPATTSEAVPLLACFFYAALFAAARDLLRPFRGSNPTWLRYPAGYRNRLTPSSTSIENAFLTRVTYLRERLTIEQRLSRGRVALKTASVLHLTKRGAGFDGCLTSPPYATRIDYVRSALAELSVLGLPPGKLADLRKRTTGTPVVRGIPRAAPVPLSYQAEQVIETISGHTSHGSANYYAPWITNYFYDIQQSIQRITKSMSAEGRIGILVQDSHYKTERIPLQEIVIEMTGAFGWRLTIREDHVVRHSIARMNPSARQHLANRENLESFLLFVPE